ncbi:ankyrin, partial [Tuber magnatum]
NVGGLPMRYAVTHGRAKALGIMLDTSGVDVNEYLYEDVTLLHLAVEHRQTAVIQVLLARKDIDINRPGLADDCTPLYHAVRWVDRSEDVTRVLLADPRVDVNCWDTEFQTPLHVAADFGGEKLLKTLLAHPKIDLNVRDKLGQTPLYFAVRLGDCRLIRFFLEDERLAPTQHHGALGNPLHAAVGSCQLAALRLLLEDGRFDVNSTDENGDTPLHIAIQKG